LIPVRIDDPDFPGPDVSVDLDGFRLLLPIEFSWNCYAETSCFP
jgi:hypothetical protein